MYSPFTPTLKLGVYFILVLSKFFFTLPLTTKEVVSVCSKA